MNRGACGSQGVGNGKTSLLSIAGFDLGSTESSRFLAFLLAIPATARPVLEPQPAIPPIRPIAPAIAGYCAMSAGNGSIIAGKGVMIAGCRSIPVAVQTR